MDDTAEPGIYRGLRAGTAFSVSALPVRGTAAERALGAWLRHGRPGMDPSLDSSLFSREEEIFRCISTTDLEKRHLDELKFIHFLRNKPQKQRSDYYLVSILSMTGKDGRKHHVRHRVFYVAIQPNGSIRLALCLYNLTDDKTNTESYICESVSGKVFSLEQQDYNDLISTREKEILRLIDRGMQSKEISENLSISIHTVNRHRQNILSKLCATNSIEACRVAKQLKLI